ncbi:MAG TPA: hypothetical protein VF556_12150 [Pyrinomonadaceae bacterium]|jgi:hypothetical protein
MNKKKKADEFIKLYVPELMQLADSADEKMCLMMAQLEYWFGKESKGKKYVDGFFKFMTPSPDHPVYREGDSWEEEMGMSAEKIKNGLKPICTHYKSFTEYKNQEGDKFKGKFYCSYNHKPSHQTYYLRNHEKVNRALESLSLGNKSSIFQEKNSSGIGKVNNYESRNNDTVIPEFEDAEVVYTKTNTKNTSYITQRELESGSHYEIYTEEKDGIYQSHNVVENYNSNSRPRQKTPFPEDFTLTDEMLAWAQANRPTIDVITSTKKFIIYKRNEISDDWEGAWMKWIIGEKDEVRSNSNSGLSASEEAREKFCAEALADTELESLISQYKASIIKPILPKLEEIQFNYKVEQAIFYLTYTLKPYLIPNKWVFSILQEHFSREDIKIGFRSLCEKKIFDPYLNNHFFNVKEIRGNKNAQNSFKQEILESEIEESKQIFDYITENVLVTFNQINSKFSNLSREQLDVFVGLNLPFKTLGNKKGNYYNLKKYSSDSDYKEKVDEKLRELESVEN